MQKHDYDKLTNIIVASMMPIIMIVVIEFLQNETC